jgi:diguanylate cyclase (GGDEF)-like protein
LASTLRGTDTISRIGGDEFLILLAQTSEDEAVAIADRARCAIRRQPVLTAAGFVSATVSISVCAMTTHGGSVEQALRQLHAGIAESKQTGKDCVSISSDLPIVDAEKFTTAAK